jgi:hypothetical protein
LASPVSGVDGISSRLKGVERPDLLFIAVERFVDLADLLDEPDVSLAVRNVEKMSLDRLRSGLGFCIFDCVKLLNLSIGPALVASKRGAALLWRVASRIARTCAERIARTFRERGCGGLSFARY